MGLMIVLQFSKQMLEFRLLNLMLLFLLHFLAKTKVLIAFRKRSWKEERL
jgi:hypothetical protein